MSDTNPEIIHSRPVNIVQLILLLVPAVILPIIALYVELTDQACNNTFFDPIPTLTHIVLIAIIPIANLYLINQIRTIPVVNPRSAVLINGLSIGICLYYSLVFLQNAHLALIGVPIVTVFALACPPLWTLWLGGWLYFTPMYALLAGIIIYSILCASVKSYFPDYIQYLRKGIVVGFTAVLIAGLPIDFTRWELSQIKSNPSKTKEIVPLLRNFGDFKTMLRDCYTEERNTVSLLNFGGLLPQPNAHEMQDLVYRITGKDYSNFQSVEVKNQGYVANIVPSLAHQDFDTELTQDKLDKYIGEPRWTNLALTSSTIDMSIDNQADLSHCDWTLSVKNDSNNTQEIRAIITTSPGSVISSFKIWVDDKERQTAFCRTDVAVKAYNRHSKVKKNPGIISMLDPDRYYISCGPVDSGKTRKIRIGISSPLIIDNKYQAKVFVPQIQTCNFTEEEPNIQARSQSALVSDLAALHPSSNDSNTICGKPSNGEIYRSISISPQDFGKHTITYRYDITDNIGSASPDRNSKIWQRASLQKVVNIDNLLVVIDGSQSMSNHIEDIFDALNSIPKSTKIKWVIASAETDNSFHEFTNDPSKIAQIKLAFAGGQDNSATLAKTINHSRTLANSAVLWIHDRQPIFNNELAKVALISGSNRPQLYELEIGNENNIFYSPVEKCTSVVSIPYKDSIKTSLIGLPNEWKKNAEFFEYTRIKKESNPFPDMTGWPIVPAPDDLISLWAYQKVLGLIAKDDIQEAENLAVKYHIVTPVSSAVALDKSADEKQTIQKETFFIPVVPEPPTWLYIACLAIIGCLAHICRRSKKSVSKA